MTKQEQVKEILKVIKHCGDYTNRDCAECDYRLYGQCHNQKQCEAEALYNAGYRCEAELDEKECDVVDDYTIGFATYLMQKRRDEVNRMQAEIKRLKKENACLLKTCEEKFTFDTTQNKKYSIFNSVRKEFADKVTSKLFAIFGKTICSDLDTEDITDIIDELLKEYEK